MDFATMSKNVKMQRYKTKAEFGADLDLIWENCLFFNTQEVNYVGAHFTSLLR
jgi:transcriptional activator SPT7